MSKPWPIILSNLNNFVAYSMQDVQFFTTTAELRTWFEAHHTTAKELFVGYYKKGTGKQSISWSESVDEALCFGWIDSVQRGIDEESYCLRFTPRKPKSIWSAVNIKKVAELTAQGRMQPAGLAAFAKRTEDKSGVYAFEQGDIALSDEYQQTLEKHPQAWAFFQKQPASYRKNVHWWIMSAKQEVTRLKRLQQLIDNSTAGLKVPPFRR